MWLAFLCKPTKRKKTHPMPKPSNKTVEERWPLGGDVAFRSWIRDSDPRGLGLVEYAIDSVASKAEGAHHLRSQLRLHSVGHHHKIQNVELVPDLHPSRCMSDYFACPAVFPYHLCRKPKSRWGRSVDGANAKAEEFCRPPSHHVPGELGIHEESVWKSEFPELPRDDVAWSRVPTRESGHWRDVSGRGWPRGPSPGRWRGRWRVSPSLSGGACPLPPAASSALALLRCLVPRLSRVRGGLHHRPCGPGPLLEAPVNLSD